jgi:hypothetical protein
MSLVTLKRKTQAKYNNMSVGSKTGFSLNGTHRSQGYIGQTMLSRSLPKTLMKGNVIKGHGGCCGKYPVHGIVQSAVTSENNPKIVKPSVMHTNGMLRMHYRWIWRPQPYSTTKPTNLALNTQSAYIANLAATTAETVDESSTYDEGANTSCGCPNLPKEAAPKQTTNNQIVKTRNSGNVTKANFTRPENNNPLLGIQGGNYVNAAYTQDQYINKLNSTYSKCNETKSTNCCVKPLTTYMCKKPIIGGTRSY